MGTRVKWLFLCVGLVWSTEDGEASLSNTEVSECRLTRGGHEYTGHNHVTLSGLPCQRWDSNDPHEISYGSKDFPSNNITLAENYCRNPDWSWHDSTWCYTTNPAVRWEPCATPFCECKTTKDGATYQGNVSRTQSGRACQRWDSQVPHPHTFTTGYEFLEDEISDARDFCRNPDIARTDGPWCFTADASLEWEYCDVHYCDGYGDDADDVITSTSTAANASTKNALMWPQPTSGFRVVTAKDLSAVPHRQGLSAGVVVGISVGCLLAVSGVVVGLVALIWRKAGIWGTGGSDVDKIKFQKHFDNKPAYNTPTHNAPRAERQESPVGEHTPPQTVSVKVTNGEVKVNV